MTDAVMVDSFVVLQLFSAYNFGESFKNQLMYTLLYCMIYHESGNISIHLNCVSLHL